MYKLLIICSIFLYSHAEVSLNNFFPYGPSQGDTTMFRSDDGSSPEIDISTNYRFFGLNQSFLWVNVNGAISFKSVIDEFTPSCAPVVGAFSMISPYWADVDISRTGNIYYRESRDSIVLQQANMEIRNAFPEIDNTNMTWAYIITWYNVTYYPDTGPHENKTRNFFQCALATDGRFSYAIFYYNQMLWTTGDASGGQGGLGGTPAQAGFDAGDGLHRFMIDGSCQDDINTTLVTQSNVGKPGVWVFSVANSTIIAPPTRPTTTSTKKIATTPTTTVKTTPTSVKTTPKTVKTTPTTAKTTPTTVKTTQKTVKTTPTNVKTTPTTVKTTPTTVKTTPKTVETTPTTVKITPSSVKTKQKTVKTTPTNCPTTTTPISGLSDYDEIPCSCNKPTIWLNIIVVIYVFIYLLI